MRLKIVFAVAGIATLSATTLPALAGDIQGDAYGCHELWVMRNQIYKSAGYCFTSQRAIEYFGNGGCTYHDQSKVPLSDQDRQIISDIRRSIKRQGC